MIMLNDTSKFGLSASVIRERGSIKQFFSRHLGDGYGTEGNSQLDEYKRFVECDFDEKQFISNHSGYDYSGSENFEHDDNGCTMNFSGCYDQIMQAFVTNEGWQEGYDY